MILLLAFGTHEASMLLIISKRISQSQPLQFRPRVMRYTLVVLTTTFESGTSARRLLSIPCSAMPILLRRFVCLPIHSLCCLILWIRRLKHGISGRLHLLNDIFVPSTEPLSEAKRIFFVPAGIAMVRGLRPLLETELSSYGPAKAANYYISFRVTVEPSIVRNSLQMESPYVSLPPEKSPSSQGNR